MRVLRILITGSRDWSDYELIETVLSTWKDWPVIFVSGACPTGADRMGEEIAKKLGWDIELHPANWAELGKRAGFVRNSDMVARGADFCVAFIKDGSKGASMTARIAQEAGIHTTTYTA